MESVEPRDTIFAFNLASDNTVKSPPAVIFPVVTISVTPDNEPLESEAVPSLIVTAERVVKSPDDPVMFPVTSPVRSPVTFPVTLPVRSPVTAPVRSLVTLLKTTSLLVPTACPIEMVPELIETPVPALKYDCISDAFGPV